LIFKESLLSLIDNSGVKSALCICVLNHNRVATPGTVLVTTIKVAIPKKFKKKKKQIRKGEIHKLLLCTSRKNVYRRMGHHLSGPANTAVVLRKDNISLPFANRIKNSIFFETRDISSKLLIMATNIF